MQRTVEGWKEEERADQHRPSAELGQGGDHPHRTYGHCEQEYRDALESGERERERETERAASRYSHSFASLLRSRQEQEYESRVRVLERRERRREAKERERRESKEQERREKEQERKRRKTENDARREAKPSRAYGSAADWRALLQSREAPHRPLRSDLLADMTAGDPERSRSMLGRRVRVFDVQLADEWTATTLQAAKATVELLPEGYSWKPGYSTVLIRNMDPTTTEQGASTPRAQAWEKEHLRAAINHIDSQYVPRKDNDEHRCAHCETVSPKQTPGVTFKGDWFCTPCWQRHIAGHKLLPGMHDIAMAMGGTEGLRSGELHADTKFNYHRCGQDGGMKGHGDAALVLETHGPDGGLLPTAHERLQRTLACYLHGDDAGQNEYRLCLTIATPGAKRALDFHIGRGNQDDFESWWSVRRTNGTCVLLCRAARGSFAATLNKNRHAARPPGTVVATDGYWAAGKWSFADSDGGLDGADKPGNGSIVDGEWAGGNGDAANESMTVVCTFVAPSLELAEKRVRAALRHFAPAYVQRAIRARRRSTEGDRACLYF